MDVEKAKKLLKTIIRITNTEPISVSDKVISGLAWEALDQLDEPVCEICKEIGVGIPDCQQPTI